MQACTTTVTVYRLHVAQNRSRNFAIMKISAKGVPRDTLKRLKRTVSLIFLAGLFRVWTRYRGSSVTVQLMANYPINADSIDR